MCIDGLLVFIAEVLMQMRKRMLEPISLLNICCKFKDKSSNGLQRVR